MGRALTETAFDVFQKKWMELEDLQKESIASINGMASQQAVQQQQELKAARRAQEEAEKKIEADALKSHLFSL